MLWFELRNQWCSRISSLGRLKKHLRYYKVQRAMEVWAHQSSTWGANEFIGLFTEHGCGVVYRLTCYPMAATLQFSQNMDNGFLVASLHSWSITSINLPGLRTLEPPGKRYSKSVNKGLRGAAGFPGRIPPMALPYPLSLRECQQPSSLVLMASWDRSGWWLLSLEAKFFSRWSYPLPLLTSSQVSMQWKSL